MLDGAFRLSQGNSGDLQQYRNGWIPVCDYYYSDRNSYRGRRQFWAGPESNVACRTLGYRSAETLNSYSRYSDGSTFNGYYCNGNETSLKQCDSYSVSRCSYSIRITCLSGKVIIIHIINK